MDLIRSHRILIRRLLLAVVIAEEDEWHGNAKPQQQNGNHRGEGNSARAFFAPNEEVENETDAKNNSRVQGRTLQRGRLPIRLGRNRLEQAPGEVTAEETHEHEKYEAGRDQGATRRGRQHAAAGNEDGD